MTTAAFKLSCNPPARKRVPRSRTAMVRAMLAKERFTERDAARLDRLTDRLETYEEGEEGWTAYEEACAALRDWERLKGAGKWWTESKQDRRDHLERKVKAKVQAAGARLKPLAKVRKTYNARQNEYNRVFTRDPEFRAASRAAKRLGVSGWEMHNWV